LPKRSFDHARSNAWISASVSPASRMVASSAFCAEATSRSLGGGASSCALSAGGVMSETVTAPPSLWTQRMEPMTSLARAWEMTRLAPFGVTSKGS